MFQRYESTLVICFSHPLEEESEEDTEVDPMYRDYEILSDFYKKHFVDLRVLDTTCEPSRVPPPKIEHGYVQEYLTTENVLLPGQHYHEVVYDCDPGYRLSSSSLGHMFCQQQGTFLFVCLSECLHKGWKGGILSVGFCLIRAGIDDNIP